MRRLITAAAMLAAMAFGGAAHAGAIISFQETGGNVVGTLSGSLNLSGLNRSSQFSATAAFVAAQGGTVSIGPQAALLDLIDVVVSGPANFGPGIVEWASSSSGDALYVSAYYGTLYVPRGYANGSLSATMNFTAASFSSLGMTPGDYVYSIGTQDTVTVRIARGTVPEPASLALLGLGLAGIGYQRRKRSA